MNIVQEKMQDQFFKEAKENKRFSVLYFQTIESFFQLLFMTLLFWTDLVPNFGTSNDISSFWNSFSFDFRCFFGDPSAISQEEYCKYSGALGILFISSYIVSYISGTLMTLYASANYISVISAISPVLVIFFWVSFPTINAWGGGSPYTTIDIICNISSLLPIFIGVYLFRTNEKEDKQPDQDEGDVELCC